jgi:hypothetical protein
LRVVVPATPSECASNARNMPAWIDSVLKKAPHPDPYKRYDELSEYAHELRHPNRSYAGSSSTPLIERNPLLFWKSLTLILAGIVLLLLFSKYG